MKRQALLLALLIPAAHAIDLPAVADATLRTTQPASNFGALPQLQVDSGTQALIRFDLSALPPGLTQASIDKLRCPMGLDIGAQTPDEIAISVAAELIQAARASTSTSTRKS